ncbi:MAG: GNAT family N-acetyltransferase [Cellvibrionaceae bacterium]|nr:GNAT family N-acetyltransferase [Cellvibrionaceae bacterium]
MSEWAIADLVEYPEWLDSIVEWQHAEWLRLSDAAALSQTDLSKALHERQLHMRTHLTHDAIPKTFVAYADDQPVGSVSLVRYNADPAAQLWLTNLYVQPSWRYKGIGAALLARGEQVARDLEVKDLWLCSFDTADYYLNFGWRWERTAELRGLQVEVLHKVL